MRGRCQDKVTVFQPHIICVSTWLNEEVSSLSLYDCLFVSLSLFLFFPWVALSFSAWCKQKATLCHMLASLTVIFTDQKIIKSGHTRKITFSSHRNMLNHHHSRLRMGEKLVFIWRIMAHEIRGRTGACQLHPLCLHHCLTKSFPLHYTEPFLLLYLTVKSQ